MSKTQKKWILEGREVSADQNVCCFMKRNVRIGSFNFSQNEKKKSRWGSQNQCISFLYTWRLLNLSYTNIHMKEWGRVKGEWYGCNRFRVAEVVLLYLQIRAWRCLKHSCLRSWQWHIWLNYNVYYSCCLKTIVVVWREEGMLAIFIFGRMPLQWIEEQGNKEK